MLITLISVAHTYYFYFLLVYRMFPLSFTLRQSNKRDNFYQELFIDYVRVFLTFLRPCKALVKKRANVQKLASSKKSTIFVQSS